MPSIKIGDRWDVDPRELLLRPYDGTSGDLAALTLIRNETLRATTLPEDYRDFEPDEVARYYARGDYSPVGNAWLMMHGDRPVAAAMVYPKVAFYDRPPGNFHLYVVPAFWSHGIGSRLLAHLEEAALGRGHRVLETTVAQEDHQSTGFLAGHGFDVVGQSVHLARAGMDGLPELKLPAGYAIRSVAEMGEGLDFFVETANRLGAYDPHYSLATLGDMTADWDPRGALLLSDADGRIVGVIRATRPQEKRGYLNEIKLEPASRGKGLGTALVAAALLFLAGAGVERVELDTPSENVAARSLAQHAGFEETRHWLHYLKRLGGNA